jgi:hypothetical protein
LTFRSNLSNATKVKGTIVIVCDRSTVAVTQLESANV